MLFHIFVFRQALQDELIQASQHGHRRDKTPNLLKKGELQIKQRLAWKIIRIQVAERTGLEPATPGVTGRYSNQLNYRSEFQNRCIAT